MTAPTTIEYLKYANLQMAAEALYGFDATPPGTKLVPGATTLGAISSSNLQDGNRHASKFTADEITLSGLTTDWEIVEHKSNTTTGFSGTLFKAVRDNPLTGTKAGDLVLSVRSTEFIDDEVRDSQATNSLELFDHGWAFGQIDDMQTWYSSLVSSGKINGPISVTGYSLGGHVATAFNLLHVNDTLSDGSKAIKEVVTFNGAGVGTVKAGNTLAGVMSTFRTLRNDPAQIVAGLSTSLQSAYLSIRASLASLRGIVADGPTMQAAFSAKAAAAVSLLDLLIAPSDQVARIKAAIANVGNTKGVSMELISHKLGSLSSGSAR